MSTEYSGTTTAGYPATVTIPSAGDADKLASINNGLSDLADRTACLKVVADPVQDIQFLNWSADWKIRVSPFGVADEALWNATGNLRPDSTTECFFWGALGSWVALGINSAGEFYVGQHNALIRHTTASSLKHTHGVETADGRALLFSHNDVFTATSIGYSRSAVADFTSWNNGVSLSLPAATHGSVNASCRTAAGNIIAVGGADTQYHTWVSNDNGATFTRHSFAGSYPGLTGVRPGKADRIFAWPYLLTAGGGDKFWYSDDQGATWTQSSGIGKDKIRDILYVAGIDKYMVLVDGFYAVMSDPTNVGSYSWVGTGSPGITSIATDGTNIVAAIPSSLVLLSWDGFVTARALMARAAPDLASVRAGNGQFAMHAGQGLQLSLRAFPR